MTDTFTIQRSSMVSGSYEAERRRYLVYKGTADRTWFVADQDDAASNIYVHDPADAGQPSSMRGFAGRSLTFTTVDGEELGVRAPWHSNANALFKDTGIDVRNKSRTFVVIAEERDYENGRTVLRGIIHRDKEPCIGPFNRGNWIAQGEANILDRRVFLYSKSAGGSSCGPVFPIDESPTDFEAGFWEEETLGEVHRDYNDYVREMQKEGRWQGDKNHPKYPWRKGA